MKVRNDISGGISIIIGFLLFCITSIIYTKPPFDYFSKPSIWFVISIIIIVVGFGLWISEIIKDCKEIKKIDEEIKEV